MPKTISAVPESITRADYLALMANVGFDPKDLLSLRFEQNSIEAEVVERDADGNRIIDGRLCEPNLTLTHSVSIPVIDAAEVNHV